MRSYYWARVDIDGLDNLKAWMDRIEAKPGIQRGGEIPWGANNSKELKKGGSNITTTLIPQSPDSRNERMSRCQFCQFFLQGPKRILIRVFDCFHRWRFDTDITELG